MKQRHDQTWRCIDIAKDGTWGIKICFRCETVKTSIHPRYLKIPLATITRTNYA